MARTYRRPDQGWAPVTPQALFLRIVMMVSAAEIFVMLLLPRLLPRGTSWPAGALVDASLLGLLTAPVLWFSVIRPLRSTADRAARLNTELTDKTKRLEVLHRLAFRMTETLDPQTAFAIITEATVELFGDCAASLWVMNPEDTKLTLVADIGLRYPERRRCQTLELGEGFVGRVAATHAALVVDDVRNDPRYVNRSVTMGEDFRAMMAVPLLVGTRCHGALALIHRGVEPFDAHDVDLLLVLANHAAITIEHTRLYDALTKANAALHEQTVTLKTRNAELDSFVYSASHDLKAPLVTIQGMASLLRAEFAPALGPDGAHLLSRVQANTERLERLITDLLALSRIGREARAAETVNVTELVDALMADFRDVIRTRGITVVCGDLGRVPAVPAQMEQVFSNLISNAIKYLGDQPTPQIEIGAASRDDMIEYWVKDNGIGIDPVYHAKVFQVFQRLQDVESEGSGVGLAIVWKVVEAAGGRVWVESGKGQGATFRFTWPATRCTTSDVADAQHAAAGSQSSRTSPPDHRTT
jgi:signal transduction histidine kinase